MNFRSKTSLGIALADGAGHRIRISSMQPGSLADRCGFIKPGDVITHVKLNENETMACSPYLNSFQVAQTLRKVAANSSSISITILPQDENISSGVSTSSESSNSTLHEYGGRLKHPNGYGSNNRIRKNNGNAVAFYEKTSGVRFVEEVEEMDNLICEPERNSSLRVVLSLCLWKDRLYEDWGFSLVDHAELDPEFQDESGSSGEESNSKNKVGFRLSTFKGQEKVSSMKGSYVYEVRQGMGKQCMQIMID